MNPLQPWYIGSVPLNHRTGSDIFVALFGELLQQPPGLRSLAVLLESPYPLPPEAAPYAQNARYSLCTGPPRWQGDLPQAWTPYLGHMLPTLSQCLASATTVQLLGDEADLALATLPFVGGWFGWFGYDLAWEIENLPHRNPDPLPFPVAFWYEPECFAVLDHQTQRLWVAGSSPDQLKALTQRASRPATPVELWDAPAPTKADLILKMQQADYEAAVLQAQSHIQAGDIFQANLSLRFETQTHNHGWPLYQKLHQINPSPFACYWQTPWGQVVSCSPERLVQLRDGVAQTRPIAGTRPRGATPAADQDFSQALLSNRKEIAEHIMLVDLERNDLGRVCDWGSVTVDELLTVEYYSHVMHLVSNVTGRLKPDCDAVDLVRAVFPGGTITGCPKVRCMEIIEDLEPQRRSLFYGSCGYLDQRGNLDLNILIRTLLVEHAPDPEVGTRTVWGQVGAGIVADSQPQREWAESLQKAKAQLLALGIEIAEGG